MISVPHTDKIENARGKDWSDEEDTYLLKHGPRATAKVTGRTYASCQSRYNRKGYHLLDETQRQYILDQSEVETDEEEAATPPTITHITGIQAGEEPDVEEIKAKARARYERKHTEALRKHWQEIRISHGPAMFAFISDTHLGNPGTDIDRVYREQEIVNNTPGAYTFLLGDIADSFLVGRLRDQNMDHDVTIPEEWHLVEDYINGFDNLLGFVGGNHDKWSRTLVGRDLHRDLIRDGKVLYDSDDMRLTVHVGMTPIRMRLRHQFRGSSQYNVTHGAEKSIKFDDPWPDILVSGHTHAGAIAREFTHAGKRKAAIQLGTYKMYDDWAVQEGFPMTDKSTAAALIVLPSGRWIATGSLEAASDYMHAIYDRAA